MWELFDIILSVVQLVLDWLNSRNREGNGNGSDIQTLFSSSGAHPAEIQTLFGEERP
jgi:hypothetical protein